MKYRVFDSYGFNIIDKVKFGQTKPYLDNMLSELGLSYSKVGFMLNSVEGDKVFEKVLQKFPALQKYCYTEDFHGSADPYLSSFSENWRDGKIHADKEDRDDIAAVFSKIPRPFNIPFGHLILDGINWYEDSDNTVAVKFKYLQGKHPTLNPPPFLSNRIMQDRSFDDGLKRNAVYVCIEATDEPEPRNTAEIIERLKPYLGEPKWSERECVFPREEVERLTELQAEHGKRFKAYAEEMLPKQPRRPYTGEYIPPVPHITDLSTLKKAFAETGFEKEKGNRSYLNLFSCRDEHGFYYEAYTQRLSNGYEFRVWLDISGYNFGVGSGPVGWDYYAEKEGDSLEILKVFAEFCAKMRDVYGAELARDFGDTPSWYKANRRY